MIDMQESAAMAEGRIWTVGEIVGTVDREAPKAEPGRFGWYIVYTGGASEARCQLQLERRGWSVYVPMTWRWKMATRKRGRLRAEPGAKKKLVQVRSNEPMFPGYLFVAIGSVRAEAYDLLFIPGVASVVRRERDSFVRVPQAVIDGLRAREDVDRAETVKPPKSLRFNPDQRVRITEGPFSGFDATVRRENESGEIELDLFVFGHATPATMPVDWIEAL